VNLFPCLVTAPDGEVFDTCRVHSGPDGCRVWWWDRELGDARVVLSSEYAPERQSAGGRTYSLPIEGEDEPAMIRHLTSCGCGHPMKRWTLPGPVREGT
jgi:hypothetical protein